VIGDAQAPAGAELGRRPRGRCRNRWEVVLRAAL